MNFAMWGKALTVIPAVSKDEWDALDGVSKWLIASRAAVLVMTALSAVLAGVFVLHDGLAVEPWAWLVLLVGLVLSHCVNNMLNDYTDFVRGVDKDNYFRTQYGPQPVANGLMTKRQLLTMAGVTALASVACALVLIFANGNDPVIWLLFGLGLFFVVAYTWPLKYWALGELSVLVVWGPLMIGGGYYVLAHTWNWMVVLASLPYVLGVTTVIFGKHIDKLEADRAKKIFTLPVLLGEKAARWFMAALVVVPYLLVSALVALRYFTPVLAVVLLAHPSAWRTLKLMARPRPATRPEGFPEGQGGWPLYFAPIGFANNSAFGLWFLVGLLADVALRLVPATASFWR